MSTSTSGTPNLNDVPKKSVIVVGKGLKIGYYLSCRVGRKGSTWEEKGSNDGAISEPATATATATAGGSATDASTSTTSTTTGVSGVRWDVYDTFNVSSRAKQGGGDGMLELTIRIMTAKSLLTTVPIVGGTESHYAQINLDLVNIRNKEIEIVQGGELKLLITITDGGKGGGAGSPIPPAAAAIMKDVPYASRTYPCGTNHFGMMPLPSLPTTKISSKSSLDNNVCVVYGESHECMTTWITCHFIYHEIKFTIGDMVCRSPIFGKENLPLVKDYQGNDVKASLSGAKAGYGSSQYPDSLISNAVPMLELKSITTNNRVLQDGVIINHHIIPALYGTASYTQDVLYWEMKIGYEYIPSMWRDFTSEDYCNIFRRLLCNYPKPMKVTWNPFMRFGLPSKVMAMEISKIRNYIGEDIYDKSYNKESNPNPTTMISIIKEFSDALKKHNTTFMSGNNTTPGPTDVSFYGINVLYYMTNIGPFRKEVESDSTLKKWMEEMLKILPVSKVLPMEYFGPSMDGWLGGWLCNPPQFDPIPIEPKGGGGNAATTTTTTTSLSKTSLSSKSSGGSSSASASSSSSSWKDKMNAMKDKAKGKMETLAGDTKKKAGAFMAKQALKKQFG